MRSIEESLRGAFREAADEVPADSVPPLILPARRRRSWLTRQSAPPAAGRARAWAAVASSAVTVAVVVGAAASVGSVLHGHRDGDDLSALGAPGAGHRGGQAHVGGAAVLRRADRGRGPQPGQVPAAGQRRGPVHRDGCHDRDGHGRRGRTTPSPW